MAAMIMNTVFTDNVFQNMNDGVLVLNATGSIVDVNKAASAFLGLDASATNALPLAEVVLNKEENDDFLQVLLDSVYEDRTIHNRIVAFIHPDGRKLFLSVTASLLRDDSGTIKGAILVLRDMTEIERLRGSEHALNVELTKALHEVDESNKALEMSLKQGQKIRTNLTFAIIFLFVVLGIYLWAGSSVDQASGKRISAMGSAGDQSSLTVAFRPLSRSISLSGSVAPLEEMTLAAPFQGKIQSKDFFYGDRVERGQTLITLDTTEIETQLREARSEYIKARKNYAEFEQWNTTPDVSKAKRDLGQAKSQLDKAKNKILEDKALFDEGIIPKSEYDSTVQDHRDKQMQLLSSRENLQSILKKGDEEYLEIAQMELDNAETKVKATEMKLAQAEVKAPVSGIAIRPSFTEKEAKNIATGMTVSEGQSLISVASLEGLSITTQVDELDINNIETGQSVLVSGDAFPGIQLNGQISQISSQANEGQVPTFTAVIRLWDLPKNVEKKVRLGMSANMEIEIYSNPKALMVPLAAVKRMGGKTLLSVLGDEGQIREVEVKTGHTTLTEVEILSGLEEGQTILLVPSES
ncbi:MAG: efflux RND transporter periplasmic adaptor subunit [Pseudodesulfovibrio sp.]|nr:efflux RND transporter periplasmic adaptor subunit [Pseudodesulfovibrio sp.]